MAALGKVTDRFGTTRRLRAALLASTALVMASMLPAAGPARAQDATWLASPGSGDFNIGANWDTGSVPTGTAFFGASYATSLTFSSGTTVVGGWTLNVGASAYSYTNSQFLGFNGAGSATDTTASAAITNTTGVTLSFSDT
jgi:hypothetical protein